MLTYLIEYNLRVLLHPTLVITSQYLYVLLIIPSEMYNIDLLLINFENTVLTINTSMTFVSLLDFRQFSTYATKRTGPSQLLGRADKIWGERIIFIATHFLSKNF